MWSNMSYYLYKLQFTTPLHVGDSRLANGLESVQLNICADTLFSALCHTVLQLEGREALSLLLKRSVQTEYFSATPCLISGIPFSSPSRL